ncbi:hypothetical protein FXV77_05530 [Sphingobacterium phlebotomi]|uniref:Uncharacterized protein n=1 Tax=Sphingobacterium phlebotomi TaxID=2605433 RepID=A0A5D4H9B7_9SPHI|nr:hypothetical protein [Sphingobacterium phlebotomi]TYR37466.1 hypothetical protein FXV77_05530 [Sphingobacterium phlebotomi]
MGTTPKHIKKGAREVTSLSSSPICKEFIKSIPHKPLLIEFAVLLIEAGDWENERCPLWKIRSSVGNIPYIQLAIKTSRKNKESMDFLPTPTASEGRRGSSRKLTTENEKVKNVSMKGVSYGISISQLAEQGFLPTPTSRLWKADCSVDRKNGYLEDSIASVVSEEDKRAKINPIFLSAMMGFPLEWIRLPFQNKKNETVI